MSKIKTIELITKFALASGKYFLLHTFLVVLLPF